MLDTSVLLTIRCAPTLLLKVDRTTCWPILAGPFEAKEVHAATLAS
jgi:hypothetical protein